MSSPPDCYLRGPLLSPSLVPHRLLPALRERGLWPVADVAAALHQALLGVRARLQRLQRGASPDAVQRCVLPPLLQPLGYVELRAQPSGDGALLSFSLVGTGGACLPAFVTSSALDLDAAAAGASGAPVALALRALGQGSSAAGLLTNGHELRLLLPDALGGVSQIVVPLSRGKSAPEISRLLAALAAPAGVRAVPALLADARRQLSWVQKRARQQMRGAVERFLTAVLKHPENRARAAELRLPGALAQLHGEALLLLHRLLTLLLLEDREESPRPAFADSAAFLPLSPTRSLGPMVRDTLTLHVRDGGHLERRLRQLSSGAVSGEAIEISLSGPLFAPDQLPLLQSLRWGERAAAHLLDGLLWLPAAAPGADEAERQQKDAAPLPLRYEHLTPADLDQRIGGLPVLLPGYADREMCRLRMGHVEVVVPRWQGERYRQPLGEPPLPESAGPPGTDVRAAPDSGARFQAPIRWLEEIPPGQVYLRPSPGETTPVSAYAPAAFVRFLVAQAVDTAAALRSPIDDPRPAELLRLRVLDPALGSGAFLAEVCRQLGEHLYQACRRCADGILVSGDPRRPAVLRQRLLQVPDPDGQLLSLLLDPALRCRDPAGNEARARALCRRLVAALCLYGVDRDPRTVAQARALLWAFCHADGLPPPFLEHRLVCGDALTGPSFGDVLDAAALPYRDDRSLLPRLRPVFEERLLGSLLRGDQLDRKSVGGSVDLPARQRLLTSALRPLLPYRLLAAAWAGNVQLGGQHRLAFQHLCAKLHLDSTPRAVLPFDNLTRGLITRGLGLAGPPTHGDAERAVLRDGGVPAVVFELFFPEVFYPRGSLAERSGFDIVLGNPPWGALAPDDSTALQAHALSLLGQARPDHHRRYMLRQPQVQAAQRTQDEAHRALRHVIAASYPGQAFDERSAAEPLAEGYRLFLERAVQLCAPGGQVAVLLPAAFHTAEAARPLRQIFLTQLTPRALYSFVDEDRLFGEDTKVRCDLLVASKPALHRGPGEPMASVTGELPCAFGLTDPAWLFDGRREREGLHLSLGVLRRIGGAALALCEPRGPRDIDLLRICHGRGVPLAQVASALRINLGDDAQLRLGAQRLSPVTKVLRGGDDPRDPAIGRRLLRHGMIPCYDGLEIMPCDERGGPPPSGLLSAQQIHGRAWLGAAVHYRLALHLRGDPSLTLAAALIPGPVTFSPSVLAEQAPAVRPTSHVLLLLGLLVSRISQWLSLRIGATAEDMPVLARLPLPPIFPDEPAEAILVHGALRLQANHAGFQRLWEELLGEHWREVTPPGSWPALPDPALRAELRAAMDAVVAHGYGMTDADYAHMLATCEPDPDERARCLRRLGELRGEGMLAFARVVDPYHDIELPRSLPMPLPDLPDAPPPISWGTLAMRRKDAAREPAILDQDAWGAFSEIRQLLIEQGEGSLGEIATRLRWPPTRTRTLVSALVEVGLLTRHGVTKASRYCLTSSCAERESPPLWI